MAVVLDALAPHVLNKINAMGQEEIRILLSVSGEISNLKDNMEPLRTALTDAERRRVTEEKVQTWVSKLKDVMYEAADILELCQLEAMERQEEHSNSSSRGGGLCSLEGVLREKLQDWREKLPFVGVGGCLGDILQPFLWCVQNLGFAHEVGTRIKKLNERLDDIIKGARRFEFLGSTLPSSSASYPRDECANLFEPDLVGEHIQKKTEKLVQELIADHGSSSSQGNVRMVAIVGLGGIGKSTLAKKVYASEAIDKEFKTKVWLSVTKQVETPVDLLRRAVNQLAGKDHCGAEQDKHTLTNSLIAALSKKKFLLVLDDVWNTEAWDHVLRIPVLNASLKQPGSQVLVTSRKDDVLDRMGASSFWRVDKLNDQDSWCLLKKQATNNSWVGAESDFDDMIDIGMKIVKKCDGLPLAIKVMGGLLGRNPTKSDWDHVWKKILHWNEVGSPAELNYSIRLSYDDLSPEVKQCFLYYSLFPKGSGFMEDIVISMWISEGLVKDYGSSESDDGSLESGQVDLEEIGARYHRELFARNLLEPDDSTENTGGYTLHDVVRTFAEFMVKEEAFVFHKDEADFRNLPENHKFRRISIFASELELTILNNQETLRTLLIDGEIKPGGSLTNFASLRVLDISSEKSDWLVNSLCGLRHLRYLAFSDTNISRLPGDIHKMRFLQHIQLNDCKKLDKLPDNVTKLTCLRYISLLGSNVDVIPRGFGGLTNLRSLYGFPVKMDGDWCTLQELWALSHLISLTVESLENVPSSSVAKMASISSKESLKYLELNCYKEDEEEEEDEEDEEEEEEDEEDVDEEEEEEEEEEVVEDEDGNPIEEYEEKQEERQVGPEQKQRIKAVFDELCPPPMLETLIISRYFGLELPEWLQSPVATSFKKLKTIALVHLIYCNRLPNGLCRIHGLEDLEIDHAPGIEHVQADFQTLTIGDGGAIVATPFKSLKRLELLGMSAWKRWDWEEEEQSKDVGMPALVFFRLRDCLLTQLPSGLASERRHNLRTIYLEELTLLECAENFPSVVTLHVHNCPGLQRISGLAKLQMLCIEGCPKLKLLEGVLVLDRMDLDDEPWEVSGPDARRTPKRQNQVTSEAVDQLLKNLVITRESSVNH